MVVYLEVIDNAFEDGRRGKSEVAKGTNRGVPIPAGLTAKGEPYFSPPVTFPPFPAGYTEEGQAYYGKSSPVMPFPMGMSILGTRFYSTEQKDTPPKNQIAGYDNQGQPFFLPRLCSIPQPAGFTNDGIAYYDIVSFASQKGILLYSKILQDIPSNFSRRRTALEMTRPITPGNRTSTKSISEVFGTLDNKGLQSNEMNGYNQRVVSKVWSPTNFPHSYQSWGVLQTDIRMKRQPTRPILWIS